MDLNQLLYHHQRALIDRASSEVSPQGRRWAGLSAAYYARQIAERRSALGREDPFTWAARPWTSPASGIVCCG